MIQHCPGCGGAVEADAKRCPECRRAFTLSEPALPAQMGFSVPLLPPLPLGPKPAAAPAPSPVPAPAPAEPPPMTKVLPAQAQPASGAAPLSPSVGAAAKVFPRRQRSRIPAEVVWKAAVIVTVAVLLAAAYFALR